MFPLRSRATDSYSTTLRRTIDGYIARHRMSGRRFGEAALGDPGFMASLTRERSLRPDTADRLLVFMGEAPIGPAFTSAFLGAKIGVGIIAAFFAWFWLRGKRLKERKRIRGRGAGLGKRPQKTASNPCGRGPLQAFSVAAWRPLPDREHPLSRADRDPAHHRLRDHRLWQDGAHLRSRLADPRAR